ncbi:MAG: ABC transporter permease, partial [Planctomycetes bacterium]|nr:ABC transporter permease [Planctomycetota bacterium]
MMRLAWRQLAGRPGLAMLAVLCVAIGIAARGTVTGTVHAIERQIAGEARQLLAADLEVSANRPYSAEELARTRAVLPASARLAEVRQLTAMVSSATNSVLCEVTAVDAEWPIYGQLRCEPTAAALAVRAGEAVAIVDPALLARLQVAVGERVRVGAAWCTIGGTLVELPGAGLPTFALGPRVVVPLAVLADAGLSGEGIRARHRLLIGLPDPARAAATAAALRARWRLAEHEDGGPPFAPQQTPVTVRTADQAARRVERVLTRATDVVRLVALIALALGALGVAAVISGLVRLQLDDIAVLRALGARRRQIAAALGWQAALIGALGGGLGVLLGCGLAALAALVIGVELAWPRLSDVALGMGLALLAAAAAAAIPLLTALRQEPLAVLRGDPLSALPRGQVLLAALGIAVVGFLAAAREARSWIWGASATAALIVSTIGIALLARVALRLLAARAPPWPLLRLASRALARRAGGALAVITALGIAVALAVVLLVVQAGFGRELRAGAKPAWFALDIQDDQRAPLLAILEEQGCAVHMKPWVRARLEAIDGRAVQAMAGGSTREAERAAQLRRREQNLTWAAAPSASERLLRGRWPGPGEAVVEERWAEALGIDLGSRLEFAVLGVPVAVVVSGIKRVDWWSFQPNFFITLHPDDLAGAPAVWLASIGAPRAGDAQALVMRLASEFPNVSLIDIAAATEAAQQIVGRASLAVAAVVAIAVLAALAVTIGTVMAAARERVPELATLAALGATRRQLSLLVLGEAGILVTLAVLLGAVSGLVSGLWLNA